MSALLDAPLAAWHLGVTTDSRDTSGALAERNTFQGERCLYNALNDRIRNLLLQYDFSKSSDPFIYWSSHISTLLSRVAPDTSDISLVAGGHSFDLHKFLLSARTPYFRKKLEAQPDTTVLNIAPSVPVEAVQIAMRYIYLGDLPRELVPPGRAVSDEEEVAKGLNKISKQLGIEQLWDAFTVGSDRRLARQRYQDEVTRAMQQIGDVFRQHVLGHKMVVDTDRVHEVRWKRDNSIFADIILSADEPASDDRDEAGSSPQDAQTTSQTIPVGPASASLHTSAQRTDRKSVLYPVHKVMLIRSEYFDAMFSGDFVESRRADHLRIINVDCRPEVLEVVLTFLYTESAACPLHLALDLLYAADMLLLDSLKSKAAQAISTLGSGSNNMLVDRTHKGTGAEQAVDETESINIYDVIHAAWDLRVQRLEEFAARYLAYRLEDYIDDDDFQDLIRQSAMRLQSREETDTIELLDDIRYYLSERFRLRFEDAGLEDMMDENGETGTEATATTAGPSSEGFNGDTPLQQHRPSENSTPVAGSDDSGRRCREEGQDEEITYDNGDAAVVTLDGDTAEDEFASDAINYQILLGKIDNMLERLKLDA